MLRIFLIIASIILLDLAKDMGELKYWKLDQKNKVTRLNNCTRLPYRGSHIKQKIYKNVCYILDNITKYVPHLLV